MGAQSASMDALRQLTAFIALLACSAPASPADADMLDALSCPPGMRTGALVHSVYCTPWPCETDQDCAQPPIGYPRESSFSCRPLATCQKERDVEVRDRVGNVTTRRITLGSTTCGGDEPPCPSGECVTRRLCVLDEDPHGRLNGGGGCGGCRARATTAEHALALPACLLLFFALLRIRDR